MIWVEAEGFALCEYPALVAALTQAEVRISLGREELIAGLVVGPDSRPVAGATVWAMVDHAEFRLPDAGRAGPGPSFAVPIEVNTGADGRFVMRGIPRGLRISWWEVRHPEFQTLSSHGDILSAGEAMTLKLAAGCSVSGVVVDESGRSIAGADVQIRSPSSAGAGRGRAPTATGDSDSETSVPAAGQCSSNHCARHRSTARSSRPQIGPRKTSSSWDQALTSAAA